MAKKANKKEKITVKLDSPKKAMDTVRSAIDKMMESEESIVNMAMSQDYQTQATIATLHNQLNLAGAALNGPPVGLKMPSVGELFGPLRTWMQDNYPTVEGQNPYSQPVKESPYQVFATLASGNFPLKFKDFVRNKTKANRLETEYSQPEKVIELILAAIAADANLKKVKYSDFSGASPAKISGWQSAFETAVYPGLNIFAKAGFEIQQSFYAILKDEFDKNIKVFDKLGSNPYLAEAELSYLQQSIMKTIRAKLGNYSAYLTRAKQIITGDAKSPTSDAGIVYVVYGDKPLADAANRKLEDVLSKNFLREVEQSYSDAIEGSGNGVFPPPGGSNFLNNLEKLIVNTLDDVPSIRHAKRKMQRSVNNILMNNIVNLGSQGALLTDTYDYELSSSINNTVTHLLNRIDGVKTEIGDSMALALSTSQSILSSLGAVTNFMTEWDSVEIALKSNQNMSIGGGEKGKGLTSSALEALMNGTNKQKPNGSYIMALIDSPDDGVGILEETENLNTIITGQMGGLNYMAGAILNKQGGVAKASDLEKTVGAQFSRSLTKLSSDLTNYNSILTQYLDAEAKHGESEEVIEAGMDVEEVIVDSKKYSSPVQKFTDSSGSSPH